MKALKKVLLGVMSLACLTAGVTACGFVGGSTANSQNGVEQTEMAQIYAQYVVYAQAEGVEPLSYEAWLATIKGEKGDKGDQGEKGEDGRGIADMQIVDGYLVVTYTDGSTQVLALPTMPEAPDTSEDPEEEEHIHTFGGWMEYHEPDTDNRGYIRVCSGCGHTEWKEEDYLDHEWTVVTTAPTCYSKGYDTKTCTICGRTERDNYTAKVAHTWSTKYSYDANYHWYPCAVCGVANEKEMHNLDEEDCSVCGCPMASTAGVLYDLSADGAYAEVIGYEGTATKVKIASTYNGVPVTAIYKEAFKNKTITSVIIPDSVTSIGNYAFSGCSSLTSVVIPDSVTSIGDWAFSYCDSLTSIEIPDSVTSIGYAAFYDCSSLTSVVIGDSVTSIGENAFAYCSSLTSVVIGDSVTSIVNYAFSDCNSLTSVYITDIAAWCAISFDNYDANPLYYAKNLYLNNQLVTDLVIPDSVTSIGYRAFYSCDSLTSVVIGDSVTSIGNYAFSNCSSLTSVVIPDSVTSISDGAFSGCTNLRFSEYENCKYLGNENNPYHALIQASNQKYSNYTIHEDTKMIADNAFYNCSRMASIVIPDSVTSIGDYAFSYCSSLTSVVIGDSVTSIGDSAFENCSNLTSVYYKGTASEWSELEVDNWDISYATLYYYSESQPTTTGRYWHYDENGEVAVW